MMRLTHLGSCKKGSCFLPRKRFSYRLDHLVSFDKGKIGHDMRMIQAFSKQLAKNKSFAIPIIHLKHLIKNGLPGLHHSPWSTDGSFIIIIIFYHSRKTLHAFICFLIVFSVRQQVRQPQSCLHMCYL